MVANFFVQNIIRLHGIPSSIVSNRDKVFTSSFWQEIHRLSGTTLKFSSTYHPKTDGQIEVMNRRIEMFLRRLVYDEQRKWLELIPWVELWHNSTFNISIGMSPFMALYGREASSFTNTIKDTSSNLKYEEEMLRRQEILELLKVNID